MKKILTLLLVLTALLAKTQTDALSYQAIIIDQSEDEIPGLDISGNYLSETEVELRFTIIDALGNSEYQEIQLTETDRYGMVNVTIGQGEVTVESSGNFDQINWDGTPKQLVVDLAIEGADFKEFTREELLFVPYAYHRNVIATGTLDVDGASTLNNTLSVTNQSPVDLSGNLNVDGESTFNSSLTVTNQSPVLMSGNLTVEGNSLLNTLTVENESELLGQTNVGGNFAVLNGSTSTMTGDAFVVGEASIGEDLTVNGESALNGQVTIDAFLLNELDNNRDAYPLRVSGASQGIHIEVNENSDNNNNFLTFADVSQVKGSIEAQSFNDLQESFEYEWDLHLYFIDLAFITAEGLAASAQLDFGEAGVMAVNAGVYGVHYQNRENYLVDTYGIYFKSGGADYAEFLERADHSETMRRGDIVGVSGGQISKNTSDADHIMVISTDPIVLGNMPDEMNESNFEKVAFLGQVPVRVVGEVELGDYILPSGNNDGMGIAKGKDEMELKDFSNILGVAWEESKSPVMNLINVAVGLNTNDMDAKILEQEERISKLERQIALLLGEELPNTTESKYQSGQKLSRKQASSAFLLSDDDFEKWLEDYGYIFEYYMDELKKEYQEKGIDYTRHEELRKWVDQPLLELRTMHKGEGQTTLWKNFIERYPEQFRTK